MSALVAKLKSTQIQMDEALRAALPAVLVVASTAVVVGGLAALRSIGVL
jgi:hypothetical protein